MDNDSHSYFGPPIKHKRTILERIEKIVHPVYFSDINLFSKLYPFKVPVSSISHFKELKRISFEDAIQRKFSPVSIGDSFGPTWSTHWFKIEIEIPKEWKDREVHFRWNSNSEAMIWINGNPIQGFSSDGGQKRTDYTISECYQPIGRFTVYVEMAANGLFGAGKDYTITAPDQNKTFNLSVADVAVFDKEIFEIIRDIKIMHDIAKEFGDESALSHNALQTANKVVNCFQPHTNESFGRAKSITDEFFSRSNGIDKYKIYAVGHCHIDSAWLWPYEESERKCGRSWSSQIGLMKKYPDYIFACSQAQQFEWVHQRYPQLFETIKEFVKKGQFVPVGGTWVEMDGNIPSGESFIRQFYYGQKYFETEFGKKCNIFWLPDTFGYSAQLPQIMKQAGIKYFLTQKISWNLVNKFPHNTFLWEGIDGTRCLTHFPPADSYEANAVASDLIKTEKQDKDKGYTNGGMLLYGYGDGGGGPTEGMLENLKRMKDVIGLPKVSLTQPDALFKDAEKVANDLSIWVGELYLELHQGTFTTQAKIKQNNRQLEFKLQELEFIYAYLRVCDKKENCPDLTQWNRNMDSLWKNLLLNQFHDVLPGSSIEMVNNDAMKIYAGIISACIDLCSMLLNGTSTKKSEKAKTQPIVLNRLPWRRTEIITTNQSIQTETNNKKQLHNGSIAYCVDVQGMSIANIKDHIVSSKDNSELQVHVTEMNDGGIRMTNNHIDVEIDSCGRITNMQLKEFKERNITMSGHPCNQLVLYDDIPFYWDAWDVMPYHLQTRREITTIVEKLKIVDGAPSTLRVTAVVTLKISETSEVEQVFTLDANCPYLKISLKVNWNENRKFLKVEFPVDVHSTFATYDIQFGHLQRPTHANTSWDAAKHEVCGHKWIDLSEHGFGVSLLSDSKYGFSTTGNVMRMSLLRSPKAPDENADIGTHEFSYAVMPHCGTFQDSGVIQQAYNFNCPLEAMEIPYAIPDSLVNNTMLSCSNPAIIIENVKVAHDNANVLIFRLYESHGCTSFGRITSCLPINGYSRCNILEEAETSQLKWKCEGLELKMKPFEIVSLMVYL